LNINDRKIIPGTMYQADAQKGQTLRKRCWVQLEGSNGIRDQDLKEQLWLGNRGHLAGSLLAPSKTKKETAHRVRAGDIRAPASLGSLPAPTKRRIFNICILLYVMMWKRCLMAVNLDQLAPYERTAQNKRL
jgi:hypothetical protein